MLKSRTHKDIDITRATIRENFQELEKEYRKTTKMLSDLEDVLFFLGKPDVIFNLRANRIKLKNIVIQGKTLEEIEAAFEKRSNIEMINPMPHFTGGYQIGVIYVGL